MFVTISVRACGRYLVLVALLVDGDGEFGDVRDELIALGFPQSLHADLQVFHQDFLKEKKKKKGEKRNNGPFLIHIDRTISSN